MMFLDLVIIIAAVIVAVIFWSKSGWKGIRKL